LTRFVLESPSSGLNPNALVLGLDGDTQRLSLIRDYLHLYENSMDTAFRKRLEEHERPFLAELCIQSCEALAAARILLRQMAEDIYVEDVEQALTD
jgi:hypothetical protein